MLAEYIIASAIGCLESLREEWDAYDLITDNGIKIEVKSSSYLQSWKQEELSKIVFGIQPTIIIDSQRDNKKPVRQADVYVFCVLAHQEKTTVNPLNLNQWDFYILDTKVLNDKVPNQKTITLSSLLRLNPAKVQYNDLKHTICNRR